MNARSIHIVVPGPLEQRTGGYLYDARIVAGLRALGWNVDVHNLAGRFPDGDAVARAALDGALGSAPDDALVVIDGLAMGGLPESIATHRDRLRIVGLVHHALADETGLTEAARARFLESERAALDSSRGVIVTSPYTADRLRGLGVAAERVRPVLPGTSPAPAAAGPPPGAAPVLLCVATVTPRKGHDILVEALDRVRDLEWHCVCAGSLDREPGWVGSVLAAVSARRLDHRIDFVGEHDRDTLDALYHGASLLVLPSHFEGYGMALAEGLARGLPIVSTRGGAIPYTVPRDAGLLVAPGDARAFAEALKTMLIDPDVLASHAAAALRRGRALPDWDEAVRAFAAAVSELAG